MNQIFIRNPDGKTVVATYDASTTIRELKKTMHLGNMRLSHGRAQLCDHQTLSEADVSCGDTLDVSPSLPGGGCSCSCRCNIL